MFLVLWTVVAGWWLARAGSDTVLRDAASAFVSQFTHPAHEIDKCQALCEADIRCGEWRIRKAASRHNSTSTELEIECFLLSHELLLLRRTFPDLFANTHGVQVSGTKKETSDINGQLSVQLQTKAKRGSHVMRWLIDSAMAVDSSTLVNFPEHFASQCSYTVSIWVWIWRPRRGETADKVVFTTKEVHPAVLGSVAPLLPAIVYNIGTRPDQFFFAAAQGKRHKEYLGMHRGQVRYHEWTHLALTVQDNVLSAYQDGVFLDSVHYSAAEIVPMNKCVYDTNMDVTVDARMETTAEGSEGRRVSSGEAFYQRLIADPFAAHVDNTVLYVGGQPASQGEHSMAGMVGGLVVVRGRALSAEGVRALGEGTRPAPNPALQAMLRELRIPSLEGTCPAAFLQGDWYRQREWGLCPEVLCGPHCVDDALFLGWLDVKGGGEVPAVTAALASFPTRKETFSGRQSGVIGLPMDAHPGSAGEGEMAATDPQQNSKEALLQGSAMAPWVMAVQELLDLLLFPFWGVLRIFEGHVAPSPSPASSPSPRSGVQKFSGNAPSAAGRAQDLYSTAMDILADPATESTVTAQSSERVEQSARANVALVLSLWMAEDASAGQFDERDFPWSFKGAPLLAQPVHLALGHAAARRAEHGGGAVPRAEVEALVADPQSSYLLTSVLKGTSAASQLFGAEVQPQGDHRNQMPLVARTGGSAQDPGQDQANRDAFLFTVDDQGEVQIQQSFFIDVLNGSSLASVSAAPDWLLVLANVTAADLDGPVPPPALSALAKVGVTVDMLQQFLAPTTKRKEHEEVGSRSLMDTLSQGLERDEVAVALAARNEEGRRLQSTQCTAAAAHYFPVTQYVAAQFGTSHSGTGPLEEVRLIVTGGPPQGQGGEEDELHLHTEAEAHDGNPYAQTWLAKKYFWGLGGVARDELAARHWFERAAAQNDPEGLYNVGIFHNNGQAGLPQNEALALNFFHRAADHPVQPFPMAMNTVGNHYLHSQTEKNYTRAMEYFLKAAAVNSDEAHFSLAMLYREGLGCPKDIPRSVAHLAVASSWGHLRALNFLAHALFDADSWLAQYGREQQLLRRKRAMAAALTRGSPYMQQPLLSQTGPAEGGGTGLASPNVTTAATDSLLHASLVFDAFELIKIFLPDGTVVPLPYPLGNREGSCEAALPLLKHIAQMSYRPRDLTAGALRAYLKGDLRTAARWYEEAADLGVWAAQENAAYILENLALTECGAAESSEEVVECQQRLRARATHRWAQLSQAGEPRAMRKMGEALLTAPSSASRALAPSVGSNGTADSAMLFALASEQGDTESMMHLGWMLYDGTHGLTQDRAAARALFAAALSIEVEAEGGLGLLDVDGSSHVGLAGQPPSSGNLTEAERVALHEAAVMRHQYTRRWQAAGYASRTTGGAAPALAMAVANADAVLASIGWNVSVRQLFSRGWSLAGPFLPQVMTREGEERRGLRALTRPMQRWAQWLDRAQDLHPTLYVAVWETGAVVLWLLL